ncbi:MAG: ATP-binding protein [Proteobacteria bacterium]|nr:ATP-binding protein [Pseudomonadota bacterium]
MTDENEQLRKRLREIEIEIEEVKSLSQARNMLLETNITELNDVYMALNEKLKEIRSRDERIKAFEDEFRRANKLSTLGELAGSIAHEIKNPLISIQGFAKRIEKAEDGDKIKEYAGLIDKESGRLSNVLAKLLEFSRMDEPKIEPVDINGIVDDTVLFLEHHLTRFKNVTLFVEKDETLTQVEIDRIHVQQSLVNIVMNAAQAMPDGGDIRIKTGNIGGYIYISVADQGTGIAPEHLDKIFEPFFTTKKKGEGTGLGLSLSKRLVEASNGKIDVESTAGQGSIFKILLPVRHL